MIQVIWIFHEIEILLILGDKDVRLIQNCNYIYKMLIDAESLIIILKICHAIINTRIYWFYDIFIFE